MKKIIALLGCFGLLTLSGSLAQNATPALNLNAWNFVLVPTFESKKETSKDNNLSITGLNHSLQFAQLLNNIAAGKTEKLRQIYAFTESGNKTDMTPIESIEPYSLLNNLGVKSVSLKKGDESVYNSPAYFVQNILANQARGIYIMAMPDSIMQSIVENLTGSTLSKQDSNHYVVLSGKSGAFTVNTYNDHIHPSSHYPDISLAHHSACPQAPLTIKVKKPAGLKVYPSQSVYFVRHVEAHPNGIFENGNYVCQGQWRALGANAALNKVMNGKKPDYVFTTNTTNIMDGSGTAYSYIRPALTVAPFAIQHDLPLTLAPFQWQDEIDLAQALFNPEAPYFQHRKSGASILVGWEHVHIEKAVKYLLETLYKNKKAADKLPEWSFEDYDTVWELSTDKNGDLTFKTSCEGISTESLPSTCPAFFPE
jgi:hypothetical protein